MAIALRWCRRRKFRCDGLYVLDVGGAPVVYRCSSNFKGGIRVAPDNERYGSWTFTPHEFMAAVIGAVFATVNVIDRTLIANARNGGAASARRISSPSAAGRMMRC
jgi:hypothetical protein